MQNPGRFTDRGVDVDRQRLHTRSDTKPPCPLEGLADDGFELADMTERERPQERPDRRGGHHSMTEHPGRRPGTQDVGMIDVRSARDHRMHEGQHLAPRAGATDLADEAHRRVDQRLQPEPLRERRDEQQPGIGDEIRVIEGRVDPVERMRYSRH